MGALPDFRLSGQGSRYYAVSDLVRRGWTETLVQEALGAPCALVPNPHHRFGRPMRLYGEDRVFEAEARPEIARRIARTLALRRARAARLEAFEARLAELAEKIPVEVPRIGRERLEEEARAVLNPLPGQGGLFGDEGLEAACVEVLYRACERLLWALDGLYGRPGVRAARRILRRRIFQAIALKYPELAYECERRMTSDLGVP